MNCRVELVEEKLDPSSAFEEFMTANQSRAIASYVGIVQGEVAAIHYQMLRSQFEEIVKKTCIQVGRGLRMVWALHRVGLVPKGEAVSFMAVAADHQSEALEMITLLTKTVRGASILVKELLLEEGKTKIVNGHEVS